jgi:ribosomal protein L11 methyltransferase
MSAVGFDWGSVDTEDVKAFSVGRLKIVPWVEAAPPVVVPGEAAELHLEVGSAFGTGIHRTTRFILEYLAERSFDRPVLDIGTGTGILALSALTLGAPSAVGVDIDAPSLAVAARNAARNGLSDRFEGSGTLPRDRRFGLVLANILAGPLADLAPEIASLLDRDAELVLTGIAPGQVERLARIYRNLGFRILAVHEDSDWARVDLRGPW